MALATTEEKILKTLKDAAAFPLWVDNVNNVGDSVGGSSTSGGSLGRLVAKTIGDTLGWRVRPNDPKGFLAALTNSFQLQEKQGVVLAKWTPHNYAIQADLGKITGPQASLAARSKVILDQALPLLDGLKPLRPDADLEDCTALTTLITSSLQKINEEMWRIGGPVVQRVDRLFEILFDLADVFDRTSQDPDDVPGQLGAVRDLFGYGFEAGFVNLVDDEEMLTNFIIFTNYVDMLRVTWADQRKHFLGNDQSFFGSQLVLLSRDLDTIVEGVQEVLIAMESVLLGASERQSVRIELPGEAPFTLDMLLDAIEQFGMTEGKYVLQYGGKDGVQSTFIPLVDNLLDMLGLLGRVPDSEMPEGFFTDRVQFTLKNLGEFLQQARDNASAIRRIPVKFVDQTTLDTELDDLRLIVPTRDELYRTVNKALSTVPTQSDISQAFQGIEGRITRIETLIGSLVSNLSPAAAPVGTPQAVTRILTASTVPIGQPAVTFTVNVPDAKRINGIKLMGDKTLSVVMKPGTVKLPDTGKNVHLTIEAFANAQAGQREARVSYTDMSGKSSSVIVEFTVA